MKKTKFMRTAIILIVLTLVTSCFVGGTFAKYTTSGNAMDQARVAQFGVTVTGTGEMFSKTYAPDDTTVTGLTYSVESNNSNNVIAPGTRGDLGGFTISGTPEVAVKVTYKGWLQLGGDKTRWNVNDKFYCPVQVTVKSTGESGDSVIKGTDYDTPEAFETAFNEAVAAYSKEYAANTDLSTVGTDSIAISWEWPFEGDDAKDTALADFNKGGYWLPPQITVTMTASVTQID